MGGKKRKVKVGYRYFMDIHAGIGRGPVNEIVEITADEKIIFAGRENEVTSNGQIYIDKPDLFGGTDTSGEGGVQGWLEVAMGYADQAPTARVKALLGGLVPGFRGVVTTFFSGLVSAYSASPKPWQYRVRRTTRGWDGGVVWYPEKATIILKNDTADFNDSTLTEAQRSNLQQIHAMNPAHILVEAATNRDWGRGLRMNDQLDLDSYRLAADTLYSEGFGLCFRYNRQDSLDTFIQQILDTVGAVQYGDVSTGKLTLKLIRDDYNPDELPLFNYDNGIMYVQDDDASASDIAGNEIVLTWHDPVTNKDSEVRAQNLASIQNNGLISETVSYKAIPTFSLAARVVERELATAASGLTRLKLRFDRRGGVLTPAACFRVQLPERGISNMVLRVGNISENSDGSLMITAVQDVFGLPATSYATGSQPPAWTPPDERPRPVLEQAAIELPWALLAGITSAAELDRMADDAGYAGALAVAPQGTAINYVLQCDDGTGWRGDYTGDWTPAGLLERAVGRLDTVLTVTGDLSGLNTGDAVLVGNEIVRIDGVNSAAATLTVARGCADTIPAAHAAGLRVWFIENATETDGREYVAGETVQLRLLTRTARGTLAPELATVSQLTITGRAGRPYPPADVRVNGEYRDTVTRGQPLVLTWVHRNRLLQADNLVSHSEPTIAPEAGTVYPVRLYKEDVLVREIPVSGTTWTYSPSLSVDVDFDSLTIHARRDGLESWQGYRFIVEDE